MYRVLHDEGEGKTVSVPKFPVGSFVGRCNPRMDSVPSLHSSCEYSTQLVKTFWSGFSRTYDGNFRLKQYMFLGLEAVVLEVMFCCCILQNQTKLHLSAAIISDEFLVL